MASSKSTALEQSPIQLLQIAYKANKFVVTLAASAMARYTIPAFNSPNVGDNQGDH
jgi:hypothetical protein